MNGIRHAFASYFGGLYAAWRVGGIFSWLLAGVWLAYPFAVQTVIHPSDALGFQAWMRGDSIPQFLTRRALYAGEVTALVALVGLSLFQLGLTVMIYRRWGKKVTVWPLAVLLIGGIANLVWWWRMGFFDVAGALSGLTPLACAIACEMVCEKLSKDFVFGPVNRPQSMPGM
jgi:hypothetical protein